MAPTPAKFNSIGTLGAQACKIAISSSSATSPHICIHAERIIRDTWQDVVCYLLTTWSMHLGEYSLMYNAVPDKRYCLFFFTQAPSGRRVIPAYLLELFVCPSMRPDFPHLFSHHRLPPARILIWPFIASNLVSMSGARGTHS